VQVVLDRFSELLGRLDEERRGAIQRSMGLKMEQLKGELSSSSRSTSDCSAVTADLLTTTFSLASAPRG